MAASKISWWISVIASATVVAKVTVTPSISSRLVTSRRTAGSSSIRSSFMALIVPPTARRGPGS